ncbi:hypothetical protein [Flavobacterium aquidurense]|uniref:hypothetical protein n=1 Tax=Flavobacterium aquidurense TaxID=362413 RepID=UPI0028650911|nr:hypothetical protein [Flavobacterium aquidurense]MDR7372353.1 hypothetical protein [Flavobacterium aquidurense]
MFLFITFIGIYLFIKGNKYHSFLIFLFLLTDGFQFIPEPVLLFGFNVYGKDYALIYSLSIFFLLCLTGRITFPHKSIVFFSITLFSVFLLCAAIVDIGFYNPSLPGFLLIFRVNLFVLTYFWLNKIDVEVYNKVFVFILKITIIQSFLCILQVPFGVKLLTGGGITDFDVLGFNWCRYSNLPYFLFPCLFILLMCKDLIVPYKKYILMLFFMVIFFTLTRTLILGVVLTIGLSVLLGFFKNQKKLVFSFVVIFILFLPVIGARILSSTDDINTVVDADDIENGTEMTFAFRIFHMGERYLYVNQDLKHKIFGIGFIHEIDFPRDVFIFGHKDDSKNGAIIQLDQGDISWSNLFLRYGIFGTLLYFLLFMSFLICFYKNNRQPVAAAGFMFMIISLILSFGSGNFSQFDFFLVPMFFFFYLREVKEKPFLLNLKETNFNG